METVIQKLKPSKIENLIALIRLFENVFEMHNFEIPSSDYLQNLFSKPDFYVFVTIQNEQIFGGTTDTWQQYYSTKPLAYLYDLAKLQEFQRQGIGKQLIEFMKPIFQIRDLKKFLFSRTV